MRWFVYVIRASIFMWDDSSSLNKKVAEGVQVDIYKYAAFPSSFRVDSYFFTFRVSSRKH